MRPIVSTQVARARISKWLFENKDKGINERPVWFERRMAFEFGGNTYILDKEQIFPCPHCGYLDSQWSTQEVIEFFKEHLGVKPFEIEIRCTVAVIEDA